MGDALRAVVVGAGWAGEGHTRALQWCGVEVAAICARRPDAVRAVADRLGVAEASTDWRETLRRIRPDIVTIATTTGLRGDVVEEAVAQGCHVLGEKPLAATGDEAGRLFALVAAAGIKHAYGATQRYDPSCAWLAELVRDGAVGALREVVLASRSGPTVRPLMPWMWVLSLAEGGGVLNLGFTHWLAVLARVIGGEPLRAMGESRRWLERAPVVPGIRDMRDRAARAAALTPEATANLEWRTCDAEGAYTGLLRFASAAGEVAVTVVAGGGVPGTGEVNGMRLYGDDGTLVATSTGGRGFTYDISRLRAPGAEPEPLPTPPRLREALPDLGEEHLGKWAALARDFVADIRGEPHAPYPTFRDGWRYQVAIDAIRGGAGWTQLPA